MKTLILTILLATQTVSASEVADKTDALSNQLKVTTDSLQQVLARMRNAPGVQETYENPDFVVAAQRFNALAEAAMIKFEDKLKNDILVTIPKFLNRLDSIKNSPAFNKDQKMGLLAQQYKIGQETMKKLSVKYQEAIYQLYVVDLPQFEVEQVSNCSFLPGSWGTYFMKFTFQDKDIQSPIITDKRDSDCSESQTYKYERPYQTYYKQIKDVIFSKTVKQHCVSQSCVGLLAVHRSTYIHEIRQEIDKEIVFHTITDTREKLSLKSLDYELSNKLKYEIPKYFESDLSDIQDLPFDVTPEEYQTRANQSAPVGETYENTYSNPR